jgi:hypothetical protein
MKNNSKLYNISSSATTSKSLDAFSLTNVLERPIMDRSIVFTSNPCPGCYFLSIMGQKCLKVLGKRDKERKRGERYNKILLSINLYINHFCSLIDYKINTFAHHLNNCFILSLSISLSGVRQ